MKKTKWIASLALLAAVLAAAPNSFADEEAVRPWQMALYAGAFTLAPVLSPFVLGYALVQTWVAPRGTLDDLTEGLTGDSSTRGSLASADRKVLVDAAVVDAAGLLQHEPITPLLTDVFSGMRAAYKAQGDQSEHSDVELAKKLLSAAQ